MATTANNLHLKRPKNDSRSSSSGLGIRGRLLIGFFIVAFILLISTIFILTVVQYTESYATKVIDYELPVYSKLLDLGGQIYHSQTSLKRWIITDDQQARLEYDAAWLHIDRNISSIDELAKQTANTALVAKWPEIKTLLNQFKIAQMKLFNVPSGVNKLNASRQLMLDENTISKKLLDVIDGPLNASGERSGGVYDKQYQLLNHGTHQILNYLYFIKLIEYALIFIIVIASLVISLWTANKIVTPLKSAINIAKKIAAGKRNIEIAPNSNDETGELLIALDKMQAAIKDNEAKLQLSEQSTRELFDNIVKTANIFSSHSSKVAAGDFRERLEVSEEGVMAKLGNDLNSMTESLASITKQIIQACHNMMSTMEEVKQAVDVQSAGASEQASSVNEITASIEEIEKSSTQTMEKAKTLGEVAERTREKGQQGLEAVEQSIQGMKIVRDKVQTIAQTILDLSNQSQQVGEITAVVNNLAQQSKMLALNASIEAAKAGEAGKGFAVVAAEVKNLAEQSELSTSQVQKILEDIRHATEKAVMVTEEGTKGVDHGTSLVEQTGEIVRSLSDVIHETTIASQQIEAAVRQESVGIEQITVGMNEINQVTSSFVASANQTLEAINNLSTIAKSLKDRVDTYKTES